jgi:hypothetical protein
LLGDYFIFHHWSLGLFGMVSIGFSAGGHVWSQSFNYLSIMSFTRFFTTSNTTLDQKTAAQAPDFKRGDKRLEIYFQSLPRLMPT